MQPAAPLNRSERDRKVLSRPIPPFIVHRPSSIVHHVPRPSSIVFHVSRFTLHAPRSTLHAPRSTFHAPRSTFHVPRSTSVHRPLSFIYHPSFSFYKGTVLKCVTNWQCYHPHY